MVTTTVRDRDARPEPDLIQRDFSATAPDQLWVADITYIPTWAGFLYLAVVLDAFSRRIVGWSMANHLRAELVRDALDMAIYRRRPQGVIHHSDQGTQYTSIAFSMRCKEAGVRPSMGSVGDCYDNAMCESFFATLECELLARSRFKNLREAQLAIFDFIERWYNPHRRHSAIGCEPQPLRRINTSGGLGCCAIAILGDALYVTNGKDTLYELDKNGRGMETPLSQVTTAPVYYGYFGLRFGP